MNIDKILKTGIENIDVVYGGVRGTTLSSRKNMRHWKTLVESGVKTIVELREEDHSNRLCKMCEKFNISYFAFPIDSHKVPNEVVAGKLKEFFEVIDSGNFYIACAMGLHRTDIALSIYWTFYGADRDIQPPFLKGHVENGDLVLDRVHNKMFRRLNSLYEYLSELDVISLPDKEIFAHRKRILVDSMQKKF